VRRTRVANEFQAGQTVRIDGVEMMIISPSWYNQRHFSLVVIAVQNQELQTIAFSRFQGGPQKTNAQIGDL